MPVMRVVEPSAPSPLARLVDDYLTSCRARGLSPRTVDVAFAFALQNVFLPWCADEGIDDVAVLDQRTLDRFTSVLLTGGGKRGKALSKLSVQGRRKLRSPPV